MRKRGGFTSFNFYSIVWYGLRGGRGEEKMLGLALSLGGKGGRSKKGGILIFHLLEGRRAGRLWPSGKKKKGRGYVHLSARKKKRKERATSKSTCEKKEGKGKKKRASGDADFVTRRT